MKAICCLFGLDKRTRDKIKNDATTKSKLGFLNSVLGWSCLALKRGRTSLNNSQVAYYKLEHINDIKQIIKNKIAKKHEMGIDFSNYHAFYNLSQET